MAYDAELADRIRELLAVEPGVVEKQMFGGLAFLIGGHMAVAASGAGGLMLRCDPGQTAELIARPGAGSMVMRGKEMAGWLRVETEAVADDESLGAWVEVGTAYARSLPAKPA